MLPKLYLVCLVSMVTSWYPTATQDLPAINPDNLNANASHVCQKTTSEPYTVLDTTTVYLLAKTNTWCLSFPPRCTKYFLRASTVYRKVTRYRQRKEYYCCNGYGARQNLAYCVPTCEEDCYNYRGQGNCILPGLCICNHGYRGDYCESSCLEGYWGQNCTKQCDCSSTGSCDPQSGNCICHIGYTGYDCSTPCQNSFGLNCVHQCVCENNSTCNNINGKCTCRPGYYGYYCQKVCEAGSTQEECENICLCQNGGTCDTNNKCVCLPGYKGEYCTDRCDSAHYGQNCSEVCTCYSGQCHPETGECSCYMGYTGESCQRQCPPGYYGLNCSIKCTCQNGGKCYYGNNGQVECNCAGTGFNGSLCTSRVCNTTDHIQPGTAETCRPCQCPWDTTDSCHPKTGICDCTAGYRGPNCQETCSKPYWGKNCLSVCNCMHGDCDIRTGECTTCYPGYMNASANCSMPCPTDRWGPNCPFDCLCQNGADCHKTTGYCNCTAGFHGLTCEEFCPENKYGPGCISTCTCDPQKAICNPYTGQCQCKSGYSGSQCETLCVPWKYGFQCLHDCKCYQQGTDFCDPHTGECSCKSGWKGVTCNSQCDDDSWGVDCAQTCPCHPYGSCDQDSGQCLCYPGYKGTNCEQTCVTGFYGYNCTEPCPVCYEGTVCNFVTGECTQQVCPPGLTGQDCLQVCRYGTWGDNCGQRCSSSCLQNGYCNPSNGQCTCRPGYEGSQCDTVCSAGQYGLECNATCNCVAANSLGCHHIDGCQCRSGYTGTSCENECPQGFWGPECRLQCSDICESRYSLGCNPQRGVPCLCRQGYEGFSCSYTIGSGIVSGRTGSDDGSTGINGGVIGLAVLAAILFIAIIVVVVFFLRRQKQREKRSNEMRVEYGNHNGNVPVITANGTAAGVVNPTYEAQNSSNERRYPRLEQRATLPSPPRRSCEDEFDEIAEAKLRVDLSRGPSRAPSSRRTSGHYDDVDENRYTTLGSVMGGDRSSGEIGIPDWKLRKDSNHKRAANDYMFYMGQNGPKGQGHMDEGQPPPRRSRPQSGGYVNSNYDTITDESARTISSPLYDVNDLDLGIITNQNHTGASNIGHMGNNTQAQASGNTDLTADQSKTETTNRKELMAFELPSNNLDNPYDTPRSKGQLQGQTVEPSGTLGGYITPINSVNSENPYQNELSNVDILTTDQNQNKVPVSMVNNQSVVGIIDDQEDLLDFGDDNQTEPVKTETVA